MNDLPNNWPAFKQSLVAEVISLGFSDKIDSAINFIQKIPDGNFNDEDLKAIKSLGLSAGEYIQLADITNLLVRTEIFFRNSLADRNYSSSLIRSTLQNLKEKGMKSRDILDILKYKQTLVEVFTAHPTYNGSPEYTDKMLALFSALENGDDISDAVKQVLSKPSVRLQDMSVSEESALMIKHLKIAEASVEKLREDFDSAIKEIFPDEQNELPELSVYFKSWGIGGADKDGNKNAIESDLADGIIQLEQSGLKNVSLEFRDTSENNILILDNIIPESVIFSHIPREFVLHNIKTYRSLSDLRNINLDNFRSAVDSILTRMHHADEKALTIFNSFEDVQKFTELPEKFFVETMKNFTLKDQRIYSELQKNITGQVREMLVSALLDLDRYSGDEIKNWCDTSFAKLEERMAADAEFKEAVAAKGYKLPEYSYFYQAVKRARHIEGKYICHSHVCAEASLPIEYKEQLLFHRAVSKENRKIILLFEEPEVLKKNVLRRTIDTMLEDDIIFSHIIRSSIAELKKRYNIELPVKMIKSLHSLKPEFGTASYNKKIEKFDSEIRGFTNGQLTFRDIFSMEIMLAHSDNTRRGGMLGARALIYNAHQIIRNAVKKTGISPRFHEGASLTDSMRGGFMPVTSHSNLYQTHRYSKSTIQGIDIAVTYSSTISGANHLAQIICNSLKARSLKLKFIKNKDAAQRADTRAAKIIERDLQLVKTIGNTIDYYIEEYFLSDSLGYTIAQIYEKQNDIHTNKASRKSRRTENDNPYYQHPQADRTIIYSERGQHMADNYGYIGGSALRPAIDEAVSMIKNIDKVGKAYFRGAEKFEKNTTAIKNQFAGMNDSQIIKEIFRICPSLAEIKARMGFTLATTDFEMIWQKAVQLKTIKDKNGNLLEEITERPHHSQLKIMARKKDGKTPSVSGMLAWKELEFRNLASIIYTSFTAKQLNIETMSTSDIWKEIVPLINIEQRQIILVNDSANLLISELKNSANSNPQNEDSYTLKDLIHFLKDVCLFQVVRG